jgi:CAAX protease family protein
MTPAWTPLDILFLVVAAVAIPSLSAAAGRTFARTPRDQLHLARRYWLIIARGALLSLLMILHWRWAARPYSALGLDVPVGHWGRVGFCADAALACFFVFNLQYRKLSAERIASVRRRMDAFRIMPRTRGEFLLFPLLAIVGSIFEELLYRGFLVWLLAPFAGVWGAVLLSSAVFGFGHLYQGWIGVLRTALVGVAFATAYVLTHSLWWLMLAHIMVNVYGGLFYRRLIRQPPAPAQ